MKIGIIGCGLIGNKRANSVEKSDSISYVYDIDEKRAKKLSANTGAKIAVDENQILIQMLMQFLFQQLMIY